jgi:hypothetical protein
MIDIAEEEILTLTQARSEPLLMRFNDGRRPDVATVWRWCMRGVKTLKGETVQLERLKLARGIRTSREAIVRFVEAAASPSPEAPPRRPRRQTVRDAERACERQGA